MVLIGGQGRPFWCVSTE